MDRCLIAEMKCADTGGLAEVKAQAAHRWCAAVNALAPGVREFRAQLDALAATA